MISPELYISSNESEAAIEKELLKEIDDINKSPEFNIKVEADKESILKNPKLFADTLEFIEDTSEIFQDEFHKLTETVKGEDKSYKFSNKLASFLMNKKMDLPGFVLTDPGKAEKYLKKFELDNEIENIHKDSLLLIFKLPKQLDYFWRKSKHNLVNFDDRYPEEKKYLWRQNDYKKSMAVIEWGNVYHQLLPTIWDQIDYYCENNDIYLSRLNTYGEHNIGEYYYIWEVVKNADIFEEDYDKEENKYTIGDHSRAKLKKSKNQN